MQKTSQIATTDTKKRTSEPAKTRTKGFVLGRRCGRRLPFLFVFLGTKHHLQIESFSNKSGLMIIQKTTYITLAVSPPQLSICRVSRSLTEEKQWCIAEAYHAVHDGHVTYLGTLVAVLVGTYAVVLVAKVRDRG